MQRFLCLAWIYGMLLFRNSKQNRSKTRAIGNSAIRTLLSRSGRKKFAAKMAVYWLFRFNVVRGCILLIRPVGCSIPFDVMFKMEHFRTAAIDPRGSYHTTSSPTYCTYIHSLRGGIRNTIKGKGRGKGKEEEKKEWHI